MIDVFPCEDAYTQERALLEQVIERVEAQDVWIGDRNFCTSNFLTSLASKNAYASDSSTWVIKLGIKKCIGSHGQNTRPENYLNSRWKFDMEIKCCLVEEWS